jgi:adenine-specific DNA-methyltransferase
MELKREHVDAKAVNDLAREEMIDLLLTSFWDKAEKAKSYLKRFEPGSHEHLFGVNAKNEGFFLVWGTSNSPSVLDRNVFRAIVEEAQKAGLARRYHVYARTAVYTGAAVEFYKIPDRVLEHIGFNVRADALNNEEESA